MSVIRLAGPEDPGPFGAHGGDPRWTEPIMHPDHPSAPVPRIRIRSDRMGPAEEDRTGPGLAGRGLRTAQGLAAQAARLGRQRAAGTGPQRPAGRTPQHPAGPQRPAGRAPQHPTSPQRLALPAGGRPQHATGELPRRPAGPPPGRARSHRAADSRAQHPASPHDDGGGQPLAFMAPPGRAAQGYAFGEYPWGPGGQAPAAVAATRPQPAVTPGSDPRRHLADPYPDSYPYGEPASYRQDGYGSHDEARYYAASVRQGAEKDAAAIRQQAGEQAAALTRQAAEEAAQLTRRATEEAAQIREAAQHDTAELWAALRATQSELIRIASYITENLSADPAGER